MDGTEERKDTSQGGDSSGGQKGTSDKTSGTFTKDTQDKAVQDALSAAGRDAKSISDKAAEAEEILTNAKKSQADIKAERDQWQKDREEAEQEAVKDDPEALKSLKVRQAQARKESEQSDRQREQDARDETLKEREEQTRVIKRTQLAAEIAVEKGVDVGTILELAKNDSREAMEAVAAILPPKVDKKPLKSDDGTTLGGGASWEEIRAAYIKNPNNPAVYKRYIEAKAERAKNE